MSSSNTSPATATCTIQEGLAWKAAREYGCDMSIIEDNLGKTPAERIRAHAAALNTLLMLKAGKKMTGKEGTERTHG